MTSQLTNSRESQTQWCSLSHLLEYLSFTVFGDIMCDLKVTKGTFNTHRIYDLSPGFFGATCTSLTNDLANRAETSACIP